LKTESGDNKEKDVSCVQKNTRINNWMLLANGESNNAC